MKPVVALDIDGTLGAYHEHFLRFAAGYFGNHDPDDPAYLDYDARMPLYRHLRISKASYRQCKMAYRRGEMKRSMPMLPEPYPDARELTHALRKKGVDIWLCTTRPYLAYDEVDSSTRHWARRNGVLHQGIIWGEHKYRELVNVVGRGRVVCILDDLPAMVAQAQAVGLSAIMALRPHNERQWLALQPWPGGVLTATTHGETLEVIQGCLDQWKRIAT